MNNGTNPTPTPRIGGAARPTGPAPALGTAPVATPTYSAGPTGMPSPAPYTNYAGLTSELSQGVIAIFVGMAALVCSRLIKLLTRLMSSRLPFETAIHEFSTRRPGGLIWYLFWQSEVRKGNIA